MHINWDAVHTPAFFKSSSLEKKFLETRISTIVINVLPSRYGAYFYDAGIGQLLMPIRNLFPSPILLLNLLSSFSYAITLTSYTIKKLLSEDHPLSKSVIITYNLLSIYPKFSFWKSKPKATQFLQLSKEDSSMPPNYNISAVIARIVELASADIARINSILFCINRALLNYCDAMQNKKWGPISYKINSFCRITMVVAQIIEIIAHYSWMRIGIEKTAES